MIITIRTDKHESEIGLFRTLGEQVDYKIWPAHRDLSSTILSVISEMFKRNDIGFEDLSGIIFYEGPGSFTGLRIGASLANSLALGLKIPVVNSGEDDWIAHGLTELSEGKTEIALPVYGSDPHITQQKK